MHLCALEDQPLESHSFIEWKKTSNNILFIKYYVVVSNLFTFVNTNDVLLIVLSFAILALVVELLAYDKKQLLRIETNMGGIHRSWQAKWEWMPSQ